MKVWNVGEKDIEQFYNSKPIIIQANKMVELPDDCVVFLLSKRSLRGAGLVQVKDGDSKEARYKEGRQNIFNWASEKYRDYQVHCEERAAVNLQPFPPHKEILEYKRIMDDYDNWLVKGQPVKEEIKEIIGEIKVFMCPYCTLEFRDRLAFLTHIKIHSSQKEGNASIVSVANKSS